MRKTYIFFAALLFLPLLVRAQEILVIPRDATLEGNVFRVGQRIDVDGTIEGDAILLGTDVTINGSVGGDLIVAASRLRVNGTVSGSIRAAVSELGLDADVHRNVTAAGGRLLQAPDARIGGSLAAAFSRLEVNGSVGGSVDVVASQFVLGGTVTKDVRVRNEIGLPNEAVGTTHVKSSATIGGALVHFGPEAATVEDGAAIADGVREDTASIFSARTLNSLRLFWKLAGFLSLLSIGYLFLWAFRRSTNAMAGAMVDAPWKSLLIGLAALILTPFATILIGFTVVGIPLGLFIMAFYVMGLYLSRVMAALVIGRWLLRFAQRRLLNLPDKPWAAFLLGAFTLVVFVDLLLHWPYPSAAWVNTIGNLASFVVAIWGLGGIIIGKFRLLRKEHRGEVPA
ncbi:MAG: polymer-forming cytoskeletal protein [Candidatus Kerfeldbacteria bacterium]|nr:polymer-forming cytoskeletal protein [Candidatus Kerfeldbacteria bacterium]